MTWAISTLAQEQFAIHTLSEYSILVDNGFALWRLNLVHDTPEKQMVGL
jgi:hypothetical protein